MATTAPGAFCPLSTLHIEALVLPNRSDFNPKTACGHKGSKALIFLGKLVEPSVDLHLQTDVVVTVQGPVQNSNRPRTHRASRFGTFVSYLVVGIVLVIA